MGSMMHLRVYTSIKRIIVLEMNYLWATWHQTNMIINNKHIESTNLCRVQFKEC